MKTSFKASITNGCRLSFSINSSSFGNRHYFMLLLAAVLFVGITSTMKAGGIRGNGSGIMISDTAQSPSGFHEIAGKAGFKKGAFSKEKATAGESAMEVNTDSVLTNETNSPSLKPAVDTPVVTLVADYCVVPGMVRITAESSTSGAVYEWSTGEKGSVINVDIANLYYVVARFSNGDSAKASIKVAEELVTNGDFSDGNTGFFSEYGYTIDTDGNSELVPEGLYSIGTNAHNYHAQFYGKEHTTRDQTGNYMIVNGSTVPIGSPSRQRIIWQQTVKVLPNTNYYFSAYAMNINSNSPAQLQFEVNGVLVGTVADLNIAPKPADEASVNLNNWVRFYSNPTWISGNTTTAVIRIRNLNTDASGNDFGLDDISFSTLSPFITLVSPTGTDAQTMCFNSSIAPIVYSVGSDATGHSILNLPPGVTGSFSVPNYLTITGTPTEVGNYNYSITTIGTCNPVTVYGTINIPSASTTWLGSVSNDWSDPNNWSCATVPTATTNVVIPATATRMPRLTATSMCKVLNMEAATKLDLGGQLFTNFGGITGRGVFKGSVSSSLIIDVAEKTSTVRFDQSAPGKSNALNNFTIKGPGNLVNLNTKLALYGALAPQAGTLAINDTLILRSTAAATARVGVVTGKLAYGSAGKVQVERYFPARRSWRLVTSPLAKAGTIFETWQNGGKYEAGKGTYVSGIGATNPISDNGLDWSPMNNSSLKVGVMLTPVLDTRAALSKNAGDSSDNIPYFLFVRGDRDPVNTNTTMTNITTLSSAGKLQTGSQVFTASSNMAGITFVGNPYASPIDFSKLQLNNLKKHFWAWDPYLNTEQGGFILVEETSAGHYEMIPQSPAGLSQVLESSQAFFVETKTNGPASIVFQESAKSDASTNLTAFRPMGTTQSLRANLYHLNENNNTLLLDGVMALFDSSFSKSVDNDDVVKQSNYKEMLALVRDNKTLTLERRPLPDSDDTLFLRLTKTTQRRYRFEFEPVGLQPTLAAYLEDSYTGAKTPLNIAGNSVVDFEINGDAGSAVINRFRIIFKLATATLPVTYKNISARQVEENISVNWTVENEINIKSYEVEKSNNGIDFKKVNTTVATGTNRSTTDYKWIDENPFTGNNYYRVRNISADGKYENSKTVLVKMANAASGINVFPNPSSTDKIGVSFKNMADGIYNVRLINALGQTMLKTSIDHLAGTSFENIVPGKKLVTGVYQLVVANPDNTTTTIKVIVQ